MARLLLPVLAVLAAVAAQEVRLHDVPLPADYCHNGGVLVNGKCECTLRFEGVQCEREKCANGGRRHTFRGQQKCHCPFGLKGDKCEKVTYCEEGKGKLVNDKCECFEKWSGLFCQMRTCYNGIPTGGVDGFCLCDVGFTGPFCDEQLICENGGEVSEDNECACAVGYAGERCEECARGFVSEGGRCLPQVSEQSLLSSSPSALGWPLLAVGAAAALALLAAAAVLTLAVRRWRSKPSRTPSVQDTHPAEGTDV